MEKILNDYLEQIERCLKPLPVSERVDIVKEIKSEILELQGNGKGTAEIVGRLGNPKELARAYLGDLITKETSFSRNKALAVCAYYSLAGLSGIFVIPTLAICAPVFILCGIASPVAGALKLIGAGFHLDIPLAVHVEVAGIQNPFLVFVCSVLLGAASYVMGCGCWKLLVCYIKGMGRVKRTLFVSRENKALERGRKS